MTIVINIVSDQPREGKTSVAAVIARALKQSFPDNEIVVDCQDGDFDKKYSMRDMDMKIFSPIHINDNNGHGGAAEHKVVRTRVNEQFPALEQVDESVG
jgi:hypothetical protein